MGLEALQETSRRRGRGGAPSADVKKGPWSPSEDELLVEYVQKHGEGNWKEVAQRSGLRRCGKSCRLRWTNQLRPHLRKDRFTPAEEAAILLLHSIHGNKWAKISAQLPGRTDNSIKNFMNTRAKRQKRQGNTIYSKAAAAAAASSCTSRAHPTATCNVSVTQSTVPSNWWASSNSGASLQFAANFPASDMTSPFSMPPAAGSSYAAHYLNHSLLPCNSHLAPTLASARYCDETQQEYSEFPDPPPLVNSRQPATSSCVSISLSMAAMSHMNVGHGLDLDLPSVQSSTSNALHAFQDDVQRSSVAPCQKSHFCDPLALLGGESLTLFKDHCGASYVDPCTSTMTPTNLEAPVSSTEYGLECIIKPLFAWRSMPGASHPVDYARLSHPRVELSDYSIHI